MDNCTVLININRITASGHLTLQNLYDYVNISLKPYEQLGFFSYKTFSSKKLPVWGKENPQCFSSILLNDAKLPLNIYQNLSHKQKNSVYFNKEYSEAISSDNIDILQTLCKINSPKSGFYYCAKKTSLLDRFELDKIIKNCDQHVLIFLEIYA
ncbi:hypothetical protein [Lacrimispora sp.]|uniref:hypothetical protein n=1 Tax=Lacrimispora sp. TaxID=2719234 RepID=UPI002FDA81A0